MASISKAVKLYIDAQVSDLFSGWTLLLDDFLIDISNVLAMNEHPATGQENVDTAYRLSHVNTTKASSFSFGLAQWDLSAFRPVNGTESTIELDSNTTFISSSLAMRMLEQILRNARNAQGNLIFNNDKDENDKKVNEVINKLGLRGEKGTEKK